MPPTSHVCPMCSYENPCYFTEGEIVRLREEPAKEEPQPLSLYTGIVLEVERDQSGHVYRVMWGPPTMPARPANTTRNLAQHRGDELSRFMVPLMGPAFETRAGGGGGKEGMAHKFESPVP